jgi:hypothetical protein
MALSLEAEHYFTTCTVWEAEVDGDRCRGWVQRIMSVFERQSEGATLEDSGSQTQRTTFCSKRSVDADGLEAKVRS